MKQLYDIWFAYVMGVNCSNGGRISTCGLGPRLFYTMREDLKQFDLFSERQMEAAAATDADRVKAIYEKHLANGIKSVNYNDREYPQRLKGISHAPLVLFYKGDLSLLDSRCTVGVVGSRRCTAEGEKACEKISSELAQGGAVVISGLAQGVDSIAHRSCVDAGGRTVAFLGVPMDEYFPKTNKNFQDRLCAQHLVVSEYHCTYPYYSANFIYRNRLIAACSDALCVVQAKERSGSLATVNRAVEYEKPVFAVPGGIFTPAYSGSNKLLAEGTARVVTHGGQILSWLGFEQPAQPDTEETVDETVDETLALDRGAQAVLGCMEGAMNANLIIRASGMKAAAVKATLTALEIDGWVQRTANGEYIRIK